MDSNEYCLFDKELYKAGDPRALSDPMTSDPMGSEKGYKILCERFTPNSSKRDKYFVFSCTRWVDIILGASMVGKNIRSVKFKAFVIDLKEEQFDNVNQTRFILPAINGWPIFFETIGGLDIYVDADEVECAFIKGIKISEEDKDMPEVKIPLANNYISLKIESFAKSKNYRTMVVPNEIKDVISTYTLDRSEIYNDFLNNNGL